MHSAPPGRSARAAPATWRGACPARSGRCRGSCRSPGSGRSERRQEASRSCPPVRANRTLGSGGQPPRRLRHHAGGHVQPEHGPAARAPARRDPADAAAQVEHVRPGRQQACCRSQPTISAVAAARMAGSPREYSATLASGECRTARSKKAAMRATPSAGVAPEASCDATVCRTSAASASNAGARSAPGRASRPAAARPGRVQHGEDAGGASPASSRRATATCGEMRPARQSSSAVMPRTSRGRAAAPARRPAYPVADIRPVAQVRDADAARPGQRRRLRPSIVAAVPVTTMA